MSASKRCSRRTSHRPSRTPCSSGLADRPRTCRSTRCNWDTWPGRPRLPSRRCFRKCCRPRCCCPTPNRPRRRPSGTNRPSSWSCPSPIPAPTRPPGSRRRSMTRIHRAGLRDFPVPPRLSRRPRPPLRTTEAGREAQSSCIKDRPAVRERQRRRLP
jgi:hypothetical protein